MRFGAVNGPYHEFSGPERRRRYSGQQHSQILTEAFAPGVSAAEVAHRHEIPRGQLYTWRSKFTANSVAAAPDDKAGLGFAEAVLING